MIPQGHKENLETIIAAAQAGHLALMECKDKATGDLVTVLCAVNFDGREYEMVPLAKLFADNPYNELNPPTAE
jgi:Family of unknown function (DUF6117)